MTKDELYAENMSCFASFTIHLLFCTVFRPYFDASADISYFTLYLHANVRNIKLSEYKNMFRKINCLSSMKCDNGRE